ncbi:MAG: hypothetical protein WC901_04420 [Candidatus Margulisiibacteriota bacterium]
MFKNIFLLVITVGWLLFSFLFTASSLAAPSFAKQPADFSITLQQLRRAVAAKDLPTLSSHIALETIVQSKIKKLSGQLQQNKGLALSIAGKAVSLGNAPLARLAANYIIEEYKKSSAGTRSYYLKSVTLNKVRQSGGRAQVSGTFMREGAKLFAVWRDDRWIIVGAESAFLDREFEKLLIILQNKVEQKKNDSMVIKGLRKLKFW